MDLILDLLAEPVVRAIGVILGSLVAAWLIEFIITKTLAAAAERTKTDVDDQVVDILRRPIFLTVWLYGIGWAASLLTLPEGVAKPIGSLLETLTILVWAIGLTRVGAIVLSSLAAREKKKSMLQPRTLPVFDMLMRILVVAFSLYAMFLAWDIDLTAWIASAGIIGVAFGFAAKDTLANLFSGIFILADGPYKVKDWVVLGADLRGEVTHIGIRSTRILTPDDVEITVPNAIIGNAQVLNETGGPNRRQRVGVNISVAYGSDVDQVRAILVGSVVGAAYMLESPPPKSRFRSFGESGLEFELQVWLDDPKAREWLVDEVNERIYKALRAANIEIPYPKRDLYIKQMPSAEPLARPASIPSPDISASLRG